MVTESDELLMRVSQAVTRMLLATPYSEPLARAQVYERVMKSLTADIMPRLAQERRECFLRARKTHTVAEIAKVADISVARVYAILGGAR